MERGIGLSRGYRTNERGIEVIKDRTKERGKGFI